MKQLILPFSLLVIWIFSICLLGNKIFSSSNKLKEENKQLKTENFYLKKTLYYLDWFEFRKYQIKKEANINIPNNITQSILDSIDYYNKLYDIPDKICYRLLYKESNFKLNVINQQSKCSGLYQLHPKEYRRYCKKLKLKPNLYSEIHIGSYMLNTYYNIYGRWDLALSLYNSGKISYDKNNNPIIYNCKETKNFVKFILNKNEK